MADFVIGNEEKGVVRKTVDEGRTLDNDVVSWKLDLGEFRKLAYFAPFQNNGGVKPPNNFWPDGTNRTNCLVTNDFSDIDTKGHFLLIERTEGNIVALMPLVGERTMAYLEAKERDLYLCVTTLGTCAVDDEIPLCAIGEGKTAHEAADSAWNACFDDKELAANIARRQDKIYPEVFKYLGWCSWEEYKTDIDGERLKSVISELEESPVPIRYILVDDGHLSTKDDRLVAFDPDPDKFPEGWKPVFDRRRSDKIKWMGLWFNCNGYWDGVADDNTLGINEHLKKYRTIKIWTDDDAIDTVQPGDDKESADAFYQLMIQKARSFGFDFVKVDNQARNIRFYVDTEKPIVNARNNALALEKACHENGVGLVNCMAHNSIRFQSTKHSAVTRCSEDYLMGDELNAKQHLHNSYCNMLWLGQTVWGDHDMFHSSDPCSGAMMARSKAMSGAPIYVSDPPEKLVAEAITPLCWDDGELLRPLAPATPLPDSVFINPFKDGEAFRVAAPLPNESVAVAVYNLTHPCEKIKGAPEPGRAKGGFAAGIREGSACDRNKNFDDTSVRAFKGVVKYADYANAFKGVSDISTPERILVYDWCEKTCHVLTEGEELAFEMNDFSDKFFILCPIRGGRAFIGAPDKYLSPCVAEKVIDLAEECQVELKKLHPFLLWTEDDETPKIENATIKRQSKSLWKITLNAEN